MGNDLNPNAIAVIVWMQYFERADNYTPTPYSTKLKTAIKSSYSLGG
ncbi:MAG: hypothetical protein V7K53_10235 [Nostoc sp.]